MFWHQIPAPVDINTEIFQSHTMLADCIWKSASLFPVVSFSLNFSTALPTAFSTDASSQKTFTGSWRSRETHNYLTEDHSHQKQGKHTPWSHFLPYRRIYSAVFLSDLIHINSIELLLIPKKHSSFTGFMEEKCANYLVLREFCVILCWRISAHINTLYVIHSCSGDIKLTLLTIQRWKKALPFP